jgi:hypothetical protein
MTKLLDRAIEYARELPADMQDEVASILLSFMGQDEGGTYELTPEEEAELDVADREIERGDLVGEDAVRAVLTKYRQ